jgi:hypothetical protein
MPPNDPYGRQLLEKIAQETDENNKMLRGIRRYIRWASFFAWFKVLVIVALVSLGYYQLRPYFGVIESGYYSVIETGKAILNINATINPTSQTGKHIELPSNQTLKSIFDRIKIPSEAPTSTIR